MDAYYMKACLLNHLRFVRKVPYLATEVGMFSADVATIFGSKLIEYEVKTSVEDFKNDFKKPKHIYYREKFNGAEVKGDRSSPWVPHFFYFAVTPEIVEEVANRLITKPYCGLVVVERVPNIYALRDAIKTVIKPKPIHEGAIEQTVYQQFLFRMGSELASLHNLKLRKDFAP